MRLFIAINFTRELSAELFKIIRELSNNALKGNFTRLENLHLTLVFLGESQKLAEVKRAMDMVQAPKFTLSIRGFGVFPQDSGSLYWAGIDNNLILNDIYNQLNSRLAEAGFAPEKRPFKPHLTLGRKVILRRDFKIRQFEQRIGPLDMGVDSFSLMKSERTDGKLVYTKLYTRHLG